MIDLNTYIISDTHFHHANIIKYCNRPQGHDRQMQQNWHEIISPSDSVLHLGDLMVWYGVGVVSARSLVKSLPGKKSMILGNHDKEKPDYYKELGFKIVDPFIQEFEGVRVLFSHHPDTERIGEWDVNIHGHIHSSGWPASIVNTRDYRNVSVEVMNYEPVKLNDILYNKHFESSKHATLQGDQEDRWQV